MTKRNRIRSLSLLIVFAMLLSCFAIKLNANTAQAAAKLKVKSPKVVAVNCKITITTNVKATFKSSNKKIATVNKKGVVTGKKKGKVKITVTSKKNKKQKKTVKITVKDKLVILQPTSSNATLMQGESLKIKANKASKFESSNTQVASVNSNGKVTANKAGTAIITVTAKKNKKQKETVTIVVKEKGINAKVPTATPGTTVTEPPMPTDNPFTEPYVVELEVSYPGDKIPKSQAEFLIGNKFKFNYTLIYSDGKSEKLYLTNENRDDFQCEYKGIIEENGVEFAKSIITYKENISAEVKVQVVDAGDYLCPKGILAEYNGESLSVDEVPSFEDLTFLLYYEDVTTKENVQLDKSKFWSYLYSITETNELMYYIYYTYFFVDNNGNELCNVMYTIVYIEQK